MPKLAIAAQESFAQNYVKLHATMPRPSKALAARQAGYETTSSRQKGYALSNQDDVSDRIDELLRMAFKPDDIDMDMVKRGIMKEAMTAKSASDRLRAWELIGKTMGGFKDVHIREAVQTMTDAELAMHAAGGDKDIAEQLLKQVQGHA